MPFQLRAMRAVPAALVLLVAIHVASPIATANAAGNRSSLETVVREAVQNNPEIRAADRERAAAERRIPQAGAFDDPMLEIGVVNLPTRSFSFDREDMTMKMIGLAQRLPYPGKLELRQAIAERAAETVHHGYRETVNRVARDARVAYLDLALAIVVSDITGQNRRIVEQFVRIAESRYAVGQGDQADVLRAQNQLSRMTDEINGLTRRQRAYEEELNRILGRGARAAAPVPEMPSLRAAALSLAALRDEAVRQRPQLLALQSIAARNERALALAHKNSLPDFDLRISYGQRDRMPDGTPRSDMLNVIVAINLPVWREAKTAPRIAEARALHEQALDLYEAQRNEVVAQLGQQMAAAEQSLRSAQLYESEVLPRARLAVEATLAAYRVNRASLAALLENQMSLLRYEVALATAVADYHKALAGIDWLAGRQPI